MPANTYEGMFLLDSAKAATAWDDTVKHVHDILTKHHSEIVASRQWDERRLAYPIDGHKKGTYLLTYFRPRREPQGDRRRLPPERRHPPRAGPEGPSQAGRPPGQPGDDLDSQRRGRGRPRRGEWTSGRAAAAATIEPMTSSRLRRSTLGPDSDPRLVACRSGDFTLVDRAECDTFLLGNNRLLSDERRHATGVDETTWSG